MERDTLVAGAKTYGCGWRQLYSAKLTPHSAIPQTSLMP
jgi:hypothetical protein